MGLVIYLRTDANISGYKLMNEDKVTVFFLTDKDSWRAHDNKCYILRGGCQEVKILIKNEKEELIVAAEGVFLALSEMSNLEWNWEEVCLT